LSPELIRVDENKIYITENANIYIYSKKDFKLIKKFGKKGAGPEEFRIGFANGMLWISVIPGCIFVHSIGKISYFTTEGKFLKRFYLPVKEMDVQFYPPYTVRDNRFYQLLENEETEQWELHITEIE
jgi:hypothetical protein